MTLAEATDRLAFRDLLARYARGVDRRDLPLVRSCFTPDCRYDGALGRGTIDVAIEALRAAMSRYQATFHLMGTQHVARLDDATAEVHTGAIALHLLRGPDRRYHTVGVVYRDRCRRTPDGWRVAQRTVDRTWERDGLVPFL